MESNSEQADFVAKEAVREPSVGEVAKETLSPEEAAEMLAAVDDVATRVVTIDRFPKWWMVMYVVLPALAYAGGAILQDYILSLGWSKYLALLAFLPMAALYWVLYLTWPKLVRTGLGQDERQLMQTWLMFLPVIWCWPFLGATRGLIEGLQDWYIPAVAFAIIALINFVFLVAVLRWFRRRIQVRAFDFTESEAMWDSAQREINRRLAELDARDKAEKR
ncbi:MAG: hypothetical protein SPK50_10230 [Mobiluncus porci]|uniref:hypothetical protein n=1 Tax=Mobiluncus porci TaxID=2652278 RepID=UPI0023F52767|nr:hypothetical protein [Mobiluncus porci]MDD7541281.1 hypothetical protein [Mobiluncus porci]MDY5749489.1 hypothetical protein [Mobiluncus porci]